MAIVVVTSCVLLVFYLLCSVARAISFAYSNTKRKWIERESRFLGALLKDYDEVLRSEDQITRKASQFLDSEQLIQAGITLRLNETEQSWITNARKVVSEATWCLESFEELRKRSKSSKWFVFLLITNHLLPMLDVARGMRRIEEMINSNLGMSRRRRSSKGNKEVCARDIRATLEQSRSKVRSLLARSVVDEIDEYQSVQTPALCVSLRAAELVSSLMELIIGNSKLMDGMVEQVISVKMHVDLLPFFMEDLQSLKLESEMEKSWLVEASKTVEEAINDIAYINIAANRQKWWWWVYFSRNWRARRKLKGGIMSLGSKISDLLETKERYGFKFITGRSSNFARKSPRQQTVEYQDMDRHLSSAVENIRNRLIQLRPTSKELSLCVSAMSKELEHMHKLFKATKPTEDFNQKKKNPTEAYAPKFRSAYLEQLKKLTCEAEQYSKASGIQGSELVTTISEIKGITHAVNLLQRCIKVYSIEVRADSCSVVGLEENVYELVSQLTSNRKERSVISIVGMKGIGKTTLAKEVYNHPTIQRLFQVRRWVSVPQVFDKSELLEAVGNQVLKTQEKQGREDYWIEKVRDFLEETRYLLVLDNVSSMETWDALKVAFPVMANKSRIVLTTCKKAIASHADQNSIHHHLRLRTKQESWDLFSQIVHHCPDELQTDAKEVLGRGGGLPLAIISVGYILSWKEVSTPEEYLKELERITQGQNRTLWLDTVQVNNADLQFDEILSKCLSYFQLFSKDFEIPARRIVASWVAQGLAQVSGDEKTKIPENVAYAYLSELIRRNVVQVVQRKPNGKVKICRLPSAVRHLLLQGGNDNNSSETGSGSSLTSPKSNVDGNYNLHDSEDGNTYDTSSRQIHGLYTNWRNVLLKESFPRSVLFFDDRAKIKPGEEVGEIISRGIAGGLFGKLQTLDLERVFRPKLPETIGKLKQLTYLGLRRTYLLTIPESIGDLVKLLTLDLKHTHVRTLPSSIWKLKKIRHLYLNENCQIHRPIFMISMKDLMILSGLFVEKGHPLKDCLDKLTKLRKLALVFNLAPTEQMLVAKWIEKLTDLESLRLRSIDEKRAPQHLKLETISHLTNLSSLHLFGKLENQVIINQLPQSLTQLTLSASKIKDDPMPTLGLLPKLRSLSFHSDSYLGTRMVCCKDGFPLLLFLKLWNLDTLKILAVQNGAMQNLRYIDTRSCHNLTITDSRR